ncbi:MAG: hypothetical protein WC214_03230 [Candidatus Omnitrophota bacterium]
MTDKYLTTNSIKPTACMTNTRNSGDDWRLKRNLSGYQCCSCTVMRDNVCMVSLEWAK